MPVDEAVEMIHATPTEDRTGFAKRIWEIRRHHGDSGQIVGLGFERFSLAALTRSSALSVKANVHGDLSDMRSMASQVRHSGRPNGQ
jgi:hypothetical protein